MKNNVQKRSDNSQVFVNICNFICANYMDLKKEFQEITSIMYAAESYGLSYVKKDTIKFHFKVSTKECDSNILKLLLNEIEKLKEGASLEFVQNVDFANIYNVIIEQIEKGNVVLFIWQAKKILQNIIYEIDRIVNSEDVNKKVAILKGMIAYY